jgi:hypothetical protein
MASGELKMRRALNITVTAIVLGLTAWFAGPAAAREVPIGSITFQAQPEREVINVGGREGEFRGFRFEVRQSDVEVLDLRIVYGNGQTEDVRVRQLFRAGSSSRVIELGSPRRALRQIIVNFIPKGPARIMFVGIDNLGGGGGGSGGGEWTRLGCKDVRFLIDRDTVRVGRAEGRFSAIRLKVRRAPVEVLNLRVTFGNGTRMDVPVREVIPPGGSSRTIDLPGNNRGIDRIEMIYRAVPSLNGTAEVCIDGLERF